MRTVPGVISKLLEEKPGPFPELLPFLAFFLVWWIQYEITEHKLIDLERKNFAAGLPVKYGFPEKFISKINLMNIKLRKQRE